MAGARAMRDGRVVDFPISSAIVRAMRSRARVIHVVRMDTNF